MMVFNISAQFVAINRFHIFATIWLMIVEINPAVEHSTKIALGCDLD